MSRLPSNEDLLYRVRFFLQLKKVILGYFAGFHQFRIKLILEAKEIVVRFIVKVFDFQF